MKVIWISSESLEITWNCLKSLKKSLALFWIKYFCFQKFFKNFFEYIKMEKSNHKNENIETKYLNIMQKNQFWKVTNSLLKLEKDLIKLKDR